MSRSLQYQFRLNALTNEVSFYPKAVIKPKYLDDIIDEIALRVDLPTTTIRSVIDVLNDVIRIQLTEGNSITIEGLITIFPTLKGRFDDPTDVLTPDNFILDATASPTLVKNVRKDISFERLPYTRKSPNIANYQGDIQDNALVSIKGSFLKFNEADPNQGVFFVNTYDSSLTKRTSQYADVTATGCTISCPPLTSGVNCEYVLQARVKYTPNGTVRTGDYMFPVRSQRDIVASSLDGPDSAIFQINL